MSLQDWLKGLEGKVRDAVSHVLPQATPQRVPALVPVPVARPRR